MTTLLHAYIIYLLTHTVERMCKYKCLLCSGFHTHAHTYIHIYIHKGLQLQVRVARKLYGKTPFCLHFDAALKHICFAFSLSIVQEIIKTTALTAIWFVASDICSAKLMSPARFNFSAACKHKFSLFLTCICN